MIKQGKKKPQSFGIIVCCIVHCFKLYFNFDMTSIDALSLKCQALFSNICLCSSNDPVSKLSDSRESTCSFVTKPQVTKIYFTKQKPKLLDGFTDFHFRHFSSCNVIFLPSFVAEKVRSEQLKQNFGLWKKVRRISLTPWPLQQHQGPVNGAHLKWHPLENHKILNLTDELFLKDEESFISFSLKKGRNIKRTSKSIKDHFSKKKKLIK